jgi:hypothetical protein
LRVARFRFVPTSWTKWSLVKAPILLSGGRRGMTPNQIDLLAQMIANSLPGLVLERTGPESKPFKPENMKRLYVEWKDVRNIISGFLGGVPPLP